MWLGSQQKITDFPFLCKYSNCSKIITTYGWSHLVDSACSTDLESQKIANFSDVLILQYRNADTKACNSAEKNR